jgi:hypothetical protein
MLAGMQQDLVMPLPEYGADGRSLDELRTGANDGEDDQLSASTIRSPSARYRAPQPAQIA